MSSSTDEPKPTSTSPVSLPRITIRFCVQCKWNLRAAYFAQELLQTFSTSIGEIALVPVTGGVFTVTVLYASTSSTSAGGASVEPSTESAATAMTETLLWDRKAEGGFPETKELKNRVRNIIDPGKDMGHIDRRLKKDEEEKERKKTAVGEAEGGDDVSSSKKGAASDPKREEDASLGAREPTETPKQQEDCADCR